MSIHRSRIDFEDHYTQLPNSWLRDTRLSRRARGLLAELMSHRPGWSVSVDTLTRGGPEGRHAIMTALQELEQHGYLRRKQHNESGRFGSTDYFITNPGPQSDFPTTDEPSSEEPSSENQHPKNNRVKNTIGSEDQPTEPGAANADARAGGLVGQTDALDLLPQATSEPKPWAAVAKAAYDGTDGALHFMGMQSIAKWAIEKKSASPEAVEAAIASLWRAGRAVNKQTVAQVLDGHLTPGSGPAVSRRQQEIADYERRKGLRPSTGWEIQR